MKLPVWTEKYRPKKLDDVKGQEDIVSRLKAFVKSESMPHLLFSGPAGIGKTASATAISREIFGENWEDSILELNASVTSETPILIKENNKIKRTNFKYLSNKYFRNTKEDTIQIKDLEILSVDKQYDVKFMPVNRLFRHKVDKIAKIKYEGGEIRTSLSHSVIIINKSGDLISKKVKDLRPGDLLISFTKEIKSNNQNIDFSEYSSKEYNLLRSGKIKNPKLKENFGNKKLNTGLMWMLGLYLAEGCFSFRKDTNTSGQVIFTVGSHEPNKIETLNNIFSEEFSLEGKKTLGSSGFDRTRFSSIQFRILNTQLAKFFSSNFYTSSEKNARTKCTPSFVFSTPISLRKDFLRGYMGDATGKWDELVRYSSNSKENLIDISWLGRISGLNTSVFNDEVRIAWKLPSYSYLKSELLSAEPLINLANNLKKGNPKYFLRHQIYSKQSKRISKETIKEFINKYLTPAKTHEDKRTIKNLTKLANSSLSSILIKNIKIEDYEDYVFDVSVPDSEMFFGGTSPILLHNSDERGIDVIRHKVKDFARTRSVDEIPFKIIYLDEADALTKEAQHALRRTMEDYSNTTRFILSCNYSSKIISPIQSRCAIFRFKPLAEKEASDIIKRIAKEEGLKINDKALEIIYKAAEGDMRKAENILQATSSITKNIDEKAVSSVISFAEPKEVEKIVKYALAGKFKESKETLGSAMVSHGLSGLDIIKQIQRQLWKLDIPDREKINLIKLCGDYEFRLVEGSNEFVQLDALLAEFALVGDKK